MLKKLEHIIRVAYKSEDKTNDTSYMNLLKLILSNGHDSTLEHVNVSFKITTNRGVTHELVRHRIGCSFTQESTRYVNYLRKGSTIIYPSWISEKPREIKEAWYTTHEKTFEQYNHFIDLGLRPQEARGILPNDTKTEIWVTMNLRSLRHFFSLRAMPNAHPDMQTIAHELLLIMKKQIPIVFDEFESNLPQ
jgi:thymidylate synthase (FAD)